MRGTQVMDIAHSLSLILKQSGDRRSRGAVAHFELATYYNTVVRARNVLRQGADVAMHGSMEAALASPALMGAVVRQQLLVMVQVSLTMGSGAAVQVPRRTSGTLTGSRVAGRFGPRLVETAMRAALSTNPLHRMGHAARKPVVFASYVDNIHGVGNTAAAAAAFVAVLRHELLRTWPLQVKEGSEQMVVCRGAPEVQRPPDGTDEKVWAVVCTKDVRALCVELRFKRLLATIVPVLTYRRLCWV